MLAKLLALTFAQTLTVYERGNGEDVHCRRYRGFSYDAGGAEDVTAIFVGCEDIEHKSCVGAVRVACEPYARPLRGADVSLLGSLGHVELLDQVSIGFGPRGCTGPAVCTENLIRVDDVSESPKLVGRD